MPGTGATRSRPEEEHGEEPPACGGEHRRDNAGTEKAVSLPGAARQGAVVPTFP